MFLFSQIWFMSTPFGGWYGFSLRIQKIKCVYISHICKKVNNIYIYIFVNTIHIYIYTQNVYNININNINNIYAYISIYIYIYIMQYLNDIKLMQ